MPGGLRYQPTREPPLKDEFDEWLARVACFAFSVPPTPFIRQMNRATADTAQEAALEEGLAPLMAWLKALIDRVIRRVLGFDDLEFAWVAETSTDLAKQAEVDTAYVAAGIKSRNEIRASLGLDPLPGGDALTVAGPIQALAQVLSGGVVAKEFNPSLHPRYPAGEPDGGEFSPDDGSGSTAPPFAPSELDRGQLGPEGGIDPEAGASRFYTLFSLLRTLGPKAVFRAGVIGALGLLLVPDNSDLSVRIAVPGHPDLDIEGEADELERRLYRINPDGSKTLLERLTQGPDGFLRDSDGKIYGAWIDGNLVLDPESFPPWPDAATITANARKPANPPQTSSEPAAPNPSSDPPPNDDPYQKVKDELCDVACACLADPDRAGQKTFQACMAEEFRPCGRI